MVLPSLYNGPIIYFALLADQEPDVLIEQHDHYIKQTFRNRCRILGANGVINLTVPVAGNRGKKTKMKDVRIDYDTPWRNNHWRSIFSAYASSPFFEFTGDLFRPIYTGKKFTHLIDLNHALLEVTCDALGIETRIQLTRTFQPIVPPDPRETIHPKREFFSDRFHVKPVTYHQVFSDRFEFMAGLSILDLLFNEGPAAPAILGEIIEHKKPGQ